MTPHPHWQRYVAAGTLIATGLALTITSRRAATPARTAQAHLRAYLLDHLGGSDAALRVLSGLRRQMAGTPAGDMLSGLQREFEAERDVVRMLLEEIGSSSLSAKRVVAGSSGVVLSALGSGEPADVSFFLAVEGLAIGVQGKRLLWRAAEAWEQSPVRREEFRRLERQATDQWDRLDAYRRDLIPATFG